MCYVDLVRARGSARDKLGINSGNCVFTGGSCTAAIRAIAFASMGVSVLGPAVLCLLRF